MCLFFQDCINFNLHFSWEHIPSFEWSYDKAIAHSIWPNTMTNYEWELNRSTLFYSCLYVKVCTYLIHNHSWYCLGRSHEVCSHNQWYDGHTLCIKIGCHGEHLVYAHGLNIPLVGMVCIQPPTIICIYVILIFLRKMLPKCWSLTQLDVITILLNFVLRFLYFTHLWSIYCWSLYMRTRPLVVINVAFTYVKNKFVNEVSYEVWIILNLSCEVFEMCMKSVTSQDPHQANTHTHTHTHTHTCNPSQPWTVCHTVSVYYMQSGTEHYDVQHAIGDALCISMTVHW